MALQTGIFADLIAAERGRLTAERRSSLENPQTPLSYPAEWLLDIFQGGRTDSGIRVSELTAFQVTTFLTCVDLIGGKISSLPIHVYERSFSANRRAIHRIAYEHDYYDLIHVEPNDEMSRQTFLKAYLCHCLAWGNGYAEIQRDGANRAIAFWPRNPWKTRPIRVAVKTVLEPEPWRPFPVTIPAGAMAFSTTDGLEQNDQSELGGKSRNYRIIPNEDMLHVPGLAFDGRLGQSVVWLARNTLGLALAAEKFGGKYFANFARPGGILEMPMNLSTEQKDQSKRSWMEAQGGENSNRIAVLPPGFKWTATSNNPQEAQSKETREFLRQEICAFFHVPARMGGDNARSSKASTEQENQELLDYTLSPWISSIKLEWKRKLFPNQGIGRVPRNRFFVDIDTTELIRGDAAAREKFNASGKQWGYLNTNDVRALEKLNPIEEPWAEEYWMPINMTLVSTPIDPTHQDGAGNGIVPAKPEGTKTEPGDDSIRAHSGWYRDAFSRLLIHQKRDLRAITVCFRPILESLRWMFADAAAQEMHLNFQPGIESLRFLDEYLGALEARAADWTAAAAEETARQELERAARAIRVAVYREAAAAKAKEPILIQ
jgi:HK97 family phage portal protein